MSSQLCYVQVFARVKNARGCEVFALPEVPGLHSQASRLDIFGLDRQCGLQGLVEELHTGPKVKHIFSWPRLDSRGHDLI